MAGNEHRGKPSVGAQTEGEASVNSEARESVPIELFVTLLAPFVKLRDQSPAEMAKIIHAELDGFTPIHLTVTKSQFMDAWLFWEANHGNR